MKLATTRFGDIEIDPTNVMTFEQGIPGFNELKRFVIIQMEEGSPFHFLQAVDEGDLSFIIVDPFIFYQDYQFEIPDKIQQSLKIESQSDVAIWSIITLLDDLETATINLLGPVIINMQAKLGMQIILHNSTYQTKHPLIHHAQKEEVMIMLVLSRKIGESIMIDDSIEFTVLGVEGDVVKLGISAPQNVSIYRKEIYLSIQQANREASQSRMDHTKINEILGKRE